MRLLLDTHVFLWFISGDKRLSSSTVEQIRDPGNDVFLSAASLWEAVIKYELGKLPLPEPPQRYLVRQRKDHHIASLPISERTIQYLPALPLLHRDPFDRILVCHALQHDLTIVTSDPAIQAYAVPTIS